MINLVLTLNFYDVKDNGNPDGFLISLNVMEVLILWQVLSSVPERADVKDLYLLIDIQPMNFLEKFQPEFKVCLKKSDR